MKITLIGQPVESPDKINSFSTMWMYNLPLCLVNNGAEITFFPRLKSDENSHDWALRLIAHSEGCDAIVAPGVRYFSTIPTEVCNFLRKEFKGIVSHIYDASMLDSPHVDLTLTIMDSKHQYLDNFDRLKRHLSNNAYIGWAADHEKFKPNKGEKLRIFIDHSSFDYSRIDYTLTAMMNLHRIPVPFEARTLSNEGLIDIDINNIIVKPFNRKSVSADAFANELNEAHIFICTHPETLGQTVIEAAMAGCFILTPPNAIPENRIKLVNHMVYNGKIDWEMAIKSVNPTENRKLALKHVWDYVGKRMIIALSDHQK